MTLDLYFNTIENFHLFIFFNKVIDSVTFRPHQHLMGCCFCVTSVSRLLQCCSDWVYMCATLGKWSALWFGSGSLKYQVHAHTACGWALKFVKFLHNVATYLSQTTSSLQSLWHSGSQNLPFLVLWLEGWSFIVSLIYCKVSTAKSELPWSDGKKIET